MITAGVGVFGAVLGGVDYRMDYRTATSGGATDSSATTQTEHIKRFV